MGRVVGSPLLSGVALLLVSTLAATLGDGTIKDLSHRLAAPQVFFLSGVLMAVFSLLAARAGAGLGLFSTSCLRSKAPGLLAVRSAATVLASLGFFYAIALIPLAEIFLFVGMMPLMAAFISRLMLGESVPPAGWVGMVLGVMGVAMLFPDGFSGLTLGHVAGFVGALSGTVSLVVARMISRRDPNTLVQVFYPNLALALVALLMLPSLWVPMALLDLGQIVLYSALLFVARWTMVLVMQRLQAPVALPLMNVQFVWMVVVGFVFFAEVPTAGTVMGAILVMVAGIIALTQQARIERLARLATASARGNTVIPAE